MLERIVWPSKSLIGEGPSYVRFDKIADPPANCLKFGAWHHHRPLFNDDFGRRAPPLHCHGLVLVQCLGAIGLIDTWWVGSLSPDSFRARRMP
jgi:hypothetical protein